MRLTRIYQPHFLQTDKVFELTHSAFHHLIRVLRLVKGDKLIVFNGQGGEFLAQLVKVDKNLALVELLNYDAISRESSLQTILGQALLRSEKMDYVIQKAVELGVSEIWPLMTERCLLPQLTASRLEKRHSHWQSIIISACEQSGRTLIPILHEPITLEMALQQVKTNHQFILHAHAASQQIFAKNSYQSLTIWVGPEGGWSNKELSLADAKGCVPLQFGPRILRTETAGLVALSVFQSLFGDMSHG